MKKLILLVALPLSLSIMLNSCGLPDLPATPPQQSSSGAKTVNVGNQFHIATNAKGNTSEQENIIEQKEMTSDPTRILWMHLVDMNGRMYLRTPVRCKVTSSGKRLEPTSCVAGYNGGQYAEWYGAKTPGGQRTTELIQIDGTYGSSDPYVYWFSPMGNYFQKGDGYLLSDMPIDIKNPVDEITGLYRANEAAAAWQKEQEKKLAAGK